MITERLQQAGSFQVQMQPDTPSSITDLLVADGEIVHLVVWPGWMPQPSDAAIESALFTGVVRTVTDVTQIAGSGLPWWFGANGDHLGDIRESVQTFTGATLSAAIGSTGIATDPTHAIGVGTIDDTGLSLVSTSWQYVSEIDQVRILCALAGAEWRIRPNFLLDAAAPQSLFPTITAPVVLLADGHASAEPGGIRAFEAAQLKPSRTVAQLATRVIVLGRDGDGGAFALGAADLASNPFVNGRGGPARLQVIVDAQSATAANAGTLATNLLNLATIRDGVTLAASTPGVRRSLQPGDGLYVWRPQAGLFDPANAATYRGEQIAPVRLRAYGITWPLESTYGVSLRRQDGSHVDLTPWMRWETGQTTIVAGRGELGAEEDIASSVPSSSSAVRLAPPTLAWTPVLRAVTVDPTIGTTGEVLAASYKVSDGSCWFDFNVKFGTTGPAAGTGAYRIEGLPVLPRPSRNSNSAGRARLVDSNTGNVAWVDVLVADDGDITFRYAPVGGGAEAVVAATVPWTWAGGDQLQGHGHYPID